MPYDYKKAFPEYYLLASTPGIVTVPPMRFVCVKGEGDPNEEGGAYQQAMGLLYGISFTIKMSPRSGHAIDGYFAYVTPPLEGFWWMEGKDGSPMSGIDYARKQDFRWLSAIRLPDFVDEGAFEWARAEATRKKGVDFSTVRFQTIEEGTCVQCLHVGPYDDEPATIAVMDAYAASHGCTLDFSPTRMHHEIYLSDARRCDAAKLRTVIRHPVRRLG
jgi:hypothetical protein